MRPETKEILDTALYPWLFSHTRAEATELAQTAGWPLTGVNTPEEALEADHLHQRGFWVNVEDPNAGPLAMPGPPYRHAEGGWRMRRAAPRIGEHDAEVDAELRVDVPEPARGEADPELPPLHGVRVLDFTTVWSGPYLTQLLADLGAEVIRVENPSVFPPTTKGYLPRPDAGMMLGPLLSMYAPPAPGHPDRPYNRHAMNNSIARNKLSCTLDPRRPEARELLMRLVEQSDVFIENLKASTLHQIGIHESELLDRNPRPARPARPSGRPHRRLGVVHGIRCAVRRPLRLHLSHRSPQPGARRHPVDHLYGHRDRIGGRVRRPRRVFTTARPPAVVSSSSSRSWRTR